LRRFSVRAKISLEATFARLVILIKRTVPVNRGQFFIIYKDDLILGFISRRLLITHRVRDHCCLSGIFDHLVHLGMCAQEAVSKRQRMGTWLRSLLGAFPKTVHTNCLNLAVWSVAIIHRFGGLFRHGIAPYTKQTERLDKLLCPV
jgi:hypothetical protein